METRDTISMEAWNDPKNGWGLYRSFRSREAAMWYFERLPDTDMVQYALVEHPTRFIIAARDTNLHAHA